MPVTKGKKKTKRERRRFGSISVREPGESPAPAPARAARPVRRRGWQGPLWLNATLGGVMILAGIIAVLLRQPVFILVAYWALGGIYLYRAYRQYLAKRSP